MQTFLKIVCKIIRIDLFLTKGFWNSCDKYSLDNRSRTKVSICDTIIKEIEEKISYNQVWNGWSESPKDDGSSQPVRCHLPNFLFEHPLCASMGRFPEKNCCSFGFCPNERGGGPYPNFLAPFPKCIFGQWKESISSKMPITWTLNCFSGCIHDPQSKYSAFI